MKDSNLRKIDPIRFLFILFILFETSTGCISNQPRFEILANNEKYPNKALVYLIRDYNPALSLWEYQIGLAKLNSIADRNAVPNFKEVPLEVGEYCLLALEPGLYSFQIEKQEHRKILNLKPNNTYFIHLEIFSEGSISFPDFFLKEYARDQAITLLLQGEHLKRSSLSLDSPRSP